VLFGCNQCNVTWLVNGNRPTDGRLSRFFVVVAARLRTDNNNDNNDNKNPLSPCLLSVRPSVPTVVLPRSFAISAKYYPRHLTLVMVRDLSYKVRVKVRIRIYS